MFCFLVDVSDRNDPQAMALQREREERVRRLREQQEEERKRKLEELRQHVSHGWVGNYFWLAGHIGKQILASISTIFNSNPKI